MVLLSQKIKEFHKAISKFLKNTNKDSSNVTTATLAAYAQLGFYDDQVKALAADDRAPLEVQYHALNAIRHICDDQIDDASQLKIRTELQDVLLKKLQNKANKNAVRVWAFEALYTSFIYNPEEDNPTLGDSLEKALSDILDQPLNQVRAPEKFSDARHRSVEGRSKTNTSLSSLKQRFSVLRSNRSMVSFGQF